MSVRDHVLRFLHSIGNPAEAQFYLSLFQSEAESTFAVIVVADTVIRSARDALVADLNFLSTVGLRPIVVIGLVHADGATQAARELTARLPPGIAEWMSATENLYSTDKLQLVSFEGVGGSVDDRFARLRAMVSGTGARKIAFLGRRSGLQLDSGEIPSLVSLRTEVDAVDARLVGNQKLLFDQIRKLFIEVRHHYTVSVTSPLDLLRELFTVKGAGTLLRRGSYIDHYDSYGNVDTGRLSALIERAFGKTPRTDVFNRDISDLYIDRDYRGAAMLIDAPRGRYLTKFAVDTAARGEGIGRDLWERMTADHPRLVWRSRPKNPIARWYAQVSDGLSRHDDWTVFWKGLDLDEIPNSVRFSLAAPVDFEG